MTHYMDFFLLFKCGSFVSSVQWFNASRTLKLCDNRLLNMDVPVRLEVNVNVVEFGSGAGCLLAWL